MPAAIDTLAIPKLGLDAETAAAFGEFMSQRLLAGRMGTAGEVA